MNLFTKSRPGGGAWSAAQSTEHQLADARCACTQQLRLRLCPRSNLCPRCSLCPQCSVFVCSADFVCAAPPYRKRFSSRWGSVAQSLYVPKPPLRQDQQAGLQKGGGADTAAERLLDLPRPPKTYGVSPDQFPHWALGTKPRLLRPHCTGQPW